MDLLIAAVIIILQNISLLRIIRLGPFSAIDLFITYWVAQQLAIKTRFNDILPNIVILINLGQGIHYLLGIETPLIQWTCFVHRSFYHWLELTPLC